MKTKLGMTSQKQLFNEGSPQQKQHSKSISGDIMFPFHCSITILHAGVQSCVERQQESRFELRQRINSSVETHHAISIPPEYPSHISRNRDIQKSGYPDIPPECASKSLLTFSSFLFFTLRFRHYVFTLFPGTMCSLCISTQPSPTQLPLNFFSQFWQMQNLHQQQQGNGLWLATAVAAGPSGEIQKLFTRRNLVSHNIASSDHIKRDLVQKPILKA